MDEIWSQRVADIVSQLGSCLRSYGNFSIEQQNLLNTENEVVAVLLKIYQREDDQRSKAVFGLVIDKRLRVGYCHKDLIRKILRLEENPMLVRRSYVFNPTSFNNWICSFRPLRHLRLAA